MTNLDKSKKYYISQWSGVYPLMAYIGTDPISPQENGNHPNFMCMEEPYDMYMEGVEISIEDAEKCIKSGQATFVG